MLGKNFGKVQQGFDGFYLRFGFEASPAREQQLLLLLKEARRLLVA